MNPAATRIRAMLRDKVDGERILQRVEMVTEWLLAGSEPVRDPVTLVVTQQPLDRERIVSLKVVLDVQLKLLGKVLPDLKAVEVTGEDGQPLPTGSSDRLVLATKLIRLMREERAQVEQLPFLQ